MPSERSEPLGPGLGDQAPAPAARTRSGWRIPAAVSRVGSALLSLAGASVLIWALLPLAPGNPARLILQARGVVEPTPDQMAEVSAELGLDHSPFRQYLDWVGGLLSGDLGISYSTGRPVMTELGPRLGATAMLAVVALLLGLLLALVLGMTAAYWADRWPDRVCQGFALVSASTPSFVLALVLIQIVVIGWGVGKVSLDGDLGQVWLPAICLGVAMSDMWSRLLRATLLSYLATPSAVTLVARGSTRFRLLWRHGLPNSGVVSLNAVALGLASLFGGAAIVESVFTWPGIGSWVVEAVKSRDIPVIQTFTLIATITYVLSSLAADLLAKRLDPRLVIA